MYVVVRDAVLSFGILYQLEPRADYLWILLEYSLIILYSIERYLKLIWARYKSLSLVLANYPTTAHT